jgi:hypothetical protein
MLLIIAITFIVIAIIFFALRCIFGIFPANWEWVGIVLAVGGIGMSVPTVFQMIMGRPFLIASFEDRPLENNNRLRITLRNVQLDQKSIWKKLGIKRDTIQSIEVHFQVREAGSNTIIRTPIRAKIYDDSDSREKNRIMLPPTLAPGASIFIAYWDTQSKTVFIEGDELHQKLLIKPGSYNIEMSLVVEGESQKQIMGFIVGDTADALMWVLPNPDRRDYRIV